MKKFEYVSSKGKKKRKTLSNAVLESAEERHQRDITIFGLVFRDRMMTALRNSVGIIKRGIYVNFPPQHGAFDRLREVVEQHNYSIDNIKSNSVAGSNFLCTVQVRIPTLPQFKDILFKEGIQEGHKGYVLVNFVIGVCREFTQLLPANKLAEEAVRHFQNKETEKEGSFNPEKVIPGILKNLRAEPRYSIVLTDGSPDTKRYYQTPEGFYYRVEIDGYITAEQ